MASVGRIKVDFYSSHIGRAGCGLIYGKILLAILAVLEFRARARGKREIMVDVAINK